MQTLELQVEQDHVESLAKVQTPIVAIEELVWNGLDADATQVDVRLEFGPMDGLSKISISDNGFGIPLTDCERAFAHLGGSAKSHVRMTPAGRIPHGKSGKGRFRAFGIGNVVVWTSRYKADGEVRQFTVRGRRNSLKSFRVAEERKVKGDRTGVNVTISEIHSTFPSLSDPQTAADELSKRLALYLRKYPAIQVTYDGVRVDPARLEERTDNYPLVLKDKDGVSCDAELTVIEWKRPTERLLYFCDENGFALEECSPGIQAPGFHFTAYLKSALITDLVAEGALALKQMNPVVSSIVDAAKAVLRRHFRSRESSRAVDLVKQWKDENVYPYSSTELDPLKSVEKEVFDVCAVKVHEYLPILRCRRLQKQVTHIPTLAGSPREQSGQFAHNPSAGSESTAGAAKGPGRNSPSHRAGSDYQRCKDRRGSPGFRGFAGYSPLW